MMRIMAVRPGRHRHAAWESQPLLRSTATRRANPAMFALITFLLGLALGLIA